MSDWAEARPVRMGGRGRTCRDLWDAAPRGSWLLDYAAAAGAPRPALVRAAAACVRPALRFVSEGEDRPRLAVEAAEAWADRPTEENRRMAKAKGKAAEEMAGVTNVEAMVALAAHYAASAAWMVKAIIMERTWGTDAGWAAWRAAWAHRHAEGPESEAAAHAACADEVRRLVPFLDLAGGGR